MGFIVATLIFALFGFVFLLKSIFSSQKKDKRFKKGIKFKTNIKFILFIVLTFLSFFIAYKLSLLI